jgi:protein kinase C substrate 80K-H
VVIPLSSVNDDFCDCPDGSDEPGTAACSFLSALSPPQPVPGTATGTNNATLALPGYYCKNKGHVPTYVPFSYVNDGVCDYEYCCDGSDEWAGVGGVQCEDRCAAIGKEWRKKEAEQLKGARAALLKKAELVRQAEVIRLTVQDRIRDLEVEIGAFEAKEKDAKRKFEEVEKRERSKVVKGASGKATRTTVLAKLAKARVEELRNGLISAVAKKDAAKVKVQELEAILTAFKTEYNPNFNDEGVKRAVKAWEDYVANKDSEPEENAPEEADLEEIWKPDSEETSGINWAEWEQEEEESDVEARKLLSLSISSQYRPKLIVI